MGVIKGSDIIGWEDSGHRILCDKCCNADEDKPLTAEDFDEEDVVTCDECGGRIQ